MSNWAHYDESDARVRPGRGGSRPRTKRRPSHEDAIPGVVHAVDRGRYTVVTSTGTQLNAVKARELGRRGLVVGDEVHLVGDTSGNTDTLARIVRRSQRRSALRRTADDTDPTERVVVANADQLAIVAAVTDPEPNPRMIDRALVAGFDAGLAAVLVVTKADLASADALRSLYEPLGVSVIEVSVKRRGGPDEDPGFRALREQLQGVSTVFVGPSGVGKSTLVNALVPDAARAVGHVNAVTGRGRHTSTSSVMLAVPQGGWIIDTPGVRSFGLAHVDPEHMLHAFPDVADYQEEHCPRGCLHLSAADGCELDAWARGSHQREVKLDSIRRLLASRLAGEAY